MCQFQNLFRQHPFGENIQSAKIFQQGPHALQCVTFSKMHELIIKEQHHLVYGNRQFDMHMVTCVLF